MSDVRIKETNLPRSIQSSIENSFVLETVWHMKVQVNERQGCARDDR